MNRVQEYYEVACEYLSLSIGARFIVAAHFGLVGSRTLAYSNRDQMDRDVFVGVIEKQVLPEFQRLIRAYKGSRDNAI
jgi:hypothetical protein